jgi:hypothetical protein
VDLFSQLGDGIKYRFKRWPKISWYMGAAALDKTVGAAAGQTLSVSFNDTTCMVDQFGAAFDQNVPGFEGNQIRLGLAASMMKWPQQPGLYPTNQAQHPCITFIGFVLAVPDKSQFAGIADKNTTAHFTEQTADPWRMGSGLEGHRGSLVTEKKPFNSGFRVGHFANFQLISLGIEYNCNVILVSQIHSDCDSLAHGWSPFLQPLLGDCVVSLSVILSQLVGGQPSHFIFFHHHPDFCLNGPSTLGLSEPAAAVADGQTS